MIPQDYIEEVLRRNEITDVVGSYVQLKRKGRLYGGLCPFHNEKTPSFYVYPETQSFYCFGCGAAGDAISFVRKINNLDYVEAVKALASRAGMPEPDEKDDESRLRSRVLSINKDAARYFHSCLNAPGEEAAAARAYWRRRGLDDKTIVRFGLGYAPDDFHATYKYLRTKGYTDMELLESGLVKRSEKGNIYNIFRGRVMTPIFDLRGNVIAFGGRVLDDSKPKYINSPETIVYKKSKTVFAMQIAKKSASRRFILCEGYMDVISMQKSGIDTAVCACGTALTQEQIKLISEYADELVLSYDSDEAGQKATARALELLKESTLKVSVLQITNAKDPDEYIKKYGPERFRMLLDGTGNALEFKLAQIRKKYNLAVDKEKLDYVREALELLADGVSPTEREVYAGRIAEETDISVTAIKEQLNSAIRRNGYRDRRRRQEGLLREGAAEGIRVPYGADRGSAIAVASAEQQLAAALVRRPELIPAAADRIRPENFVMPDMQEVFGAILQLYGQGVRVTVSSLAPLLQEKTMSELSRLIAQYNEVSPTEQDVEMYLMRIERSKPKSGAAGEMSPADLQHYMDDLRRRKAPVDFDEDE